ncbi:MAG TPA: molybdopterin synthase catalytic subunit MoaE [Gammaproteobacteria bacterium]|nr:molybdopterin synthase catalytic subunit MoaE [Gammaproteobacteria bacterium]
MVTSFKRPPASVPPVVIQKAPFEAGKVIREVCAHDPEIGAVASFIGLMRDRNEGDFVKRMMLEHYPGMTEKAIGEIVDEAKQRWKLINVRVVHRVGELEPTDPIVLVVVASSHRRAAFEACEFIMDYLKTRAPFWKKEITRKGERWVQSRESDREAAGRWRK